MTCHTQTSWKPSTFNHSTTSFALVGAHVTADCASCHKNGQFKGTATDCYTCHQTDFAKVVNPNHVTAQLSHDCTTCHTTTSWKPSTFNHSTTAFALVGAHVTVDCASCHKNGQFKGTATDCYTCHQIDFTKSTSPNHVTSQLSHDCSTCHSSTAWKPSTFNHRTTAFALTGAHTTTICESCHKNGQFKGTPTDCYACHQTDFTKSGEPNHVTAQLSHDCLTCHSTIAWKPSTFNHSSTAFPLTGAHGTTQCASCHVNGKFKGTASDCYTCHKTDFATPVIPNHVTAQLSHDCTTCHSTTTWKPSTFDHKKTNFPLAGAHLTTDCASCHKNGLFKGTATDCYTCHQTKFAATTTPNHVTSQFSHDCTTCHTVNAWKPATFNHNTTAFPLTGAHTTTDCASCHKNGQFKGTATDCYSCHQTDFARPTNPNHVTAQLSHDCTTCHSTTAWKPSTFDHQKTTFKLVGAHMTTDCSSCHKNGQFTGLPTDCYSCHQTNYTNTLNPNHVTGAFSHDCTTCHSMTAWKPATFNHSTSAFPLVGAHVTVACASCHINGQFTGTPKDCWSCHQTKFNATTTPNHVTAQFSHDCTICHSMTAWKPSTFNHSTTAFPLTGAHTTTDCLFCHKNGQYKGTATDCYTCHTTDFNGVTNPNHVSGGFDHNCATCHTTTAWNPATFDHNKTNFKLTGAHLTTQCASCHVGGKYTGTSTVCYTCHTADYNNSTNPNHATAKYPTDCTTCHTTTAWKPSTFDHTPYFPIGSTAKHRPGRWNLCSDCHTNPADSKVFSCINCHEHDKASMDSKHSGRSGYSYDSNACYRCHPRGNS
ncbi:MAG TPA: hypothetical protein VK470_09440 [Bacteroidota bacterium]|nr:hypothetical protein [Bacteroidota bacterium]